MLSLTWLIVALALGLAAPLVRRAVAWALDPVTASRRDPPPLSYRPKYTDPTTKQPHAFPSLLDDTSSLALSVIIPAYNEEARLPVMLDATIAFLNERRSHYELIIVDDGSKDRTYEVAQQYAARHGTDRVRVMRLAVNQGKGGAVQQGMLHARGELLLMADADGASEIADLAKLEKSLASIKSRTGDGIAVGSRAHLAEASAASRAWYRTVLMHGFHFLVSTLCVRAIKDTQCGFKLFTRATAQKLFAIQHLRRWCFDVELLFLAQRMNIPISEVQVRWEEVPGSKLALLESSLLMARDLIVIRACYACDFWTMTPVTAAKAK